jgi:signal transduction histidine kinase
MPKPNGGLDRDTEGLRRRAEEELAKAQCAAEAANRAKNAFLCNVSHELRTPLTSILGFIDLLMSPHLSHQEQREFLDAIRRNAHVLSDFINDILDLAKIEADELVLEPTNCSLQQIVDDVVSVVKIQADEKLLDVEVDYRSPLPETIRTDPVRLRQALTKLVENAIKFTEKGGVCITVRCLRAGHSSARMQFAVADTGIGIPRDKVPGLFQPFMQGDMSQTRRYRGTGIGLAIAKRLAAMLGGDIEVTSELGKGSTFFFSLPIE